MVSVALKEKHRLEGLRHGKVGLIGRRDRMPTRASVKRTSNPLEGIETDCQALLGRFAGTEDHATVRVGSAAMSAPFAFFARRTDLSTRDCNLPQIWHVRRPTRLFVRRFAHPRFASSLAKRLSPAHGKRFPYPRVDLLRIDSGPTCNR